MRTSVRAHYALAAVFELATSKQGQPVKIADIARRQRIPQKFLELILAALRQAGFLESRRGAEGGYLLARPAEMITVGEVLRAVEAGQSTGPPRRAGEETPFSDLWRRVDETVSSVLDRTSFAQLVRVWHEKQSRFVANWQI